MLATVIGLRKLDFKTNDGNAIKGVKIFVEYSIPDDKTVEGKVSESIFIPADSNIALPTFKFGEEYDFVYETSGIGAKAKAKLTKILTKAGRPF